MPKSFKIDAKEMVSLSIYFVIVVCLTSWLMPLTFKIKGWDDQPMFYISMGIGAVLFSLLIDYAFSWAKTDKTETQPSKAVTQAHDEFESSIDEIERKRDSRVKMNFATTPSGVYQDPRTRRAFANFNTSPSHERSSDDFLLSLMVGYATDSPIMGYAAGGSLLGGMVGAGMHHNDDSSSHHVSTSHDYSPRVETPETLLGSSSSSYSDSCRASDYPSSSSDSGSSSSSSYSSSDSGSSSSDSGSSDSSSSD
jgi:hypothetical protein